MTSDGLRLLQDLRRFLLEPPHQLQPHIVTAAQPDDQPETARGDRVTSPTKPGTAAAAVCRDLDAPASGQVGRGRAAPAERGLRAVHQAVLRSFMQSGLAPDIATLTGHAAPSDVAEVLAELADGDFLYLDDAGRITAAYPFSALPTRHRVQIAGWPGRSAHRAAAR